MRSSRTIVALRRPSISGRAILGPDRRDEMQPVGREPRRQHGHLDDQWALSPYPPDPLDHLAVGHDVGPADVEALAEDVVAAADGREVGDDVVDRDRLRRRRDPARADHRRQAVDEREDRLERRAPGTDDHGGAQRRHRHGARGQREPGLDAAAQMRREIGRVVTEPAQVDELAETRDATPREPSSRRRGGRAARSRRSRASARGSRRRRRRRARRAPTRRRTRRPAPT